MKSIWHYTTNTHHLRRSPRHEVGQEIIESLLPIVAAGGGEMEGLGIKIEFGEPAKFVFSELGRDLVRCKLYTQRPWPIPIPGDCGDDVAFLSCEILPAAAMSGWLMMLGDAERCVAWAILEEGK